MKVKRVSFSGYADVYNLEVEDTHNFAVENGVIVHNCADETRYMCMANPMKPVKAKERVPSVFNPLDTDEKIDKYAFMRMY